jgi:hypothetical protein
VSRLRLIDGGRADEPRDNELDDLIAAAGHLARLWVQGVEQESVTIRLRAGVEVEGLASGTVLAHYDGLDETFDITAECDAYARRRVDQVREWERDGLV